MLPLSLSLLAVGRAPATAPRGMLSRLISCWGEQGVANQMGTV